MIRWNPARGQLAPAEVAGFDAVVHLAGENVAGGRWTEARKRRIRESRVEGTGLLARSLIESGQPPKAFVSASAVGFYGSKVGSDQDPILDESSSAGEGYLADVARAWEDASRAIEDAGSRRVLVRIGVVLDPEEGALGKMLPPFRLGVGGVVGSGRQWMPWITRDDVCAVIERAIESESLRGPVNAVAGCVQNREFVRELGRALRRPTLFPLPGFAVKLLFGEMGQRLLLEGMRVESRVLADLDHRFGDPNLTGAFRRLTQLGGSC